MPFKSQAQRRYMFATHPKIAKEFEAATPKGAKLPKRVTKKKLLTKNKKLIKYKSISKRSKKK